MCIRDRIISLADDMIFVPKIDPLLCAVAEIVPLQLLAYYLAKENGFIFSSMG